MPDTSLNREQRFLQVLLKKKKARPGPQSPPSLTESPFSYKVPPHKTPLTLHSSPHLLSPHRIHTTPQSPTPFHRHSSIYRSSDIRLRLTVFSLEMLLKGVHAGHLFRAVHAYVLVRGFRWRRTF